MTNIKFSAMKLKEQDPCQLFVCKRSAVNPRRQRMLHVSTRVHVWCVRLESLLTHYVTNCSWNFRQIYNLGAVGDKEN